MKAGVEKRAKDDSAVKKTVLKRASPMINPFWRRGSVRSLMDTHSAAEPAATPAGKPRAAPMVTPVSPTPMPTERPFSIWARNMAREIEREKMAILSGGVGSLCWECEGDHYER